MSVDIDSVFCFKVRELGLKEDTTYLNFTPSGWRQIVSIITGLGSWIAFGGTTYCLWHRNVTVKRGAGILALSGSLGYLFISYAKSVRHYDQRASIISYKREIAKRLKSDPEGVLQFIIKKHGWKNVDDYQILQPEEKKEVLRKALSYVDFFSAIKEYPALDNDVVKELWSSWSEKKTILELFEECDFPNLKKVLLDVHDLLQQKKGAWEAEIQPFNRDYMAYRMQIREDSSSENVQNQKRLITGFDYETLLNRLKELQDGFSCKEIEFF